MSSYLNVKSFSFKILVIIVNITNSVPTIPTIVATINGVCIRYPSILHRGMSDTNTINYVPYYRADGSI